MPEQDADWNKAYSGTYAPCYTYTIKPGDWTLFAGIFGSTVTWELPTVVSKFIEDAPEPELAKSKLAVYSVTDLIAALDKYNMGNYDHVTRFIETSSGDYIAEEVLKDWINSKYEHPLRIEDE